MTEVGNEMSAWEICALYLQAFAHKLQPEIAQIAGRISEVRGHWQALWTHLYDRQVPVTDAALVSKAIEVMILSALVIVVTIASVATHSIMFSLTGRWLPVSLLLGVALTGLTAAIGYQAHKRLLSLHRGVEALVITAATALCFWGLVEIAIARGTLIEKLTTPRTTSSFVDNTTDDESTEPTDAGSSTEEKARRFLSSGQMKIMLAADLILGILLGRIARIRTDDDFAAWQNLKKSSRHLGQLTRRFNELERSIDVAKECCMAGILRAKYAPRKRCVPYHRALPVILLATVFVVPPLFSQTINRHEEILIDVSGSIGKGGPQSDLFKDYLLAVKQLLFTEPPNSRIWVSLITTESFGSVSSLVKGWTPSVNGIFDDDLKRARRQLVSSFETKASTVAPVAAGTDIIGGLWQAKAMLESGSSASSMSKTIWILSDMMNESASFNMPALIPAGPEQMLQRAKINGLVVPLQGYHVYVIGASPAGLSPQAWNTLRAFWVLYFREAGAELSSYSAECNSTRE
jgi:hypothetical protein